MSRTGTGFSYLKISASMLFAICGTLKTSVLLCVSLLHAHFWEVSLSQKFYSAFPDSEWISSAVNASKKITYRVEFSSFHCRKLWCRKPGNFRGLHSKSLSKTFSSAVKLWGINDASLDLLKTKQTKRKKALTRNRKMNLLSRGSQ